MFSNFLFVDLILWLQFHKSDCLNVVSHTPIKTMIIAPSSSCVRACVCLLFFLNFFLLLFMIIVLVLLLFWLFSHHFVERILYYRYRYRHDRHRSFVRCVYYFFVRLHNFANVLAWSNFSAVLISIDWCFVARLLIINTIDGLVTSNDVSILYWLPPYDNVHMHFTSIIHFVRYFCILQPVIEYIFWKNQLQYGTALLALLENLKKRNE